MIYADRPPPSPNHTQKGDWKSLAERQLEDIFQHQSVMANGGVSWPQTVEGRRGVFSEEAFINFRKSTAIKWRGSLENSATKAAMMDNTIQRVKTPMVL